MYNCTNVRCFAQGGATSRWAPNPRPKCGPLSLIGAPLHGFFPYPSRICVKIRHRPLPSPGGRKTASKTRHPSFLPSDAGCVVFRCPIADLRHKRLITITLPSRPLPCASCSDALPILTARSQGLRWVGNIRWMLYPGSSVLDNKPSHLA